MDWRFRKSDGHPILNIQRYVSAWLDQNPGGEVHIGCDSKRRGSRVKYSVSVCMRNGNTGVHEVYATTHVQNIQDNFERLWKEVDMAVNLARELENTVGRQIAVHVDLNNDPQFLSNKLYEASMGFITSLGFKAISKPDAWAASHGAHQHCQ